jgi:uncharacterized protein (TIGR00251 family)
MRLEITVFPKSGRFEVVSKEGRVKVYLKSAPENNKANIELVKEMKKLLKADVRIVSGLTSKRKVLEIQMSKEELERLLSIDL